MLSQAISDLPDRVYGMSYVEIEGIETDRIDAVFADDAFVHLID